MDDPIGSFEKIRDNFILYIKTAFSTKNPALELEREKLLREPGAFCQEPWIEPLPRYESSGKTISDISHNDLNLLPPEDITDFQALVRCGLFKDGMKLHRHQFEMLQKAIAGKNCVVTAGTGSGKTEAFLLPLFAYLAKESRSWTAPRIKETINRWWANGSPPQRRSQRSHETRKAAVRALVLYPMNALVEDQLTRLRRALDSDEARAWYEKTRKGNRIYLGRYNGETPTAGHEKETMIE